MIKKAIVPTAVYTIKEAAPFLGVHWQTLADRVTAGEIKSKLYGNKHLIVGQHLLDYLNTPNKVD